LGRSDKNRKLSLRARAARALSRFYNHERANVAVLAALTAPIFLGASALGFETTYWMAIKQNMQNAADSAAIAASTNGSANYATEAKAVSAQFGYTDGTNHVTVTSSNSAACPSGGNTCYSVSVSTIVPLFLTQIIGFRGDTTLDNGPAKTVTATAIATKGTVARQYCVLALGTVGSAIQSNGASKANLGGCSTMSNGASTCNGGNLNADFGDAHLNNNGCGNTQTSGVPLVPDPYSGLAANIPANPCKSYSQEPTKKNDPALPASNQWSGNKSLSGNSVVCGDLQLTADVTIDAGSGATLVIENGQLDTNGHTLRTPSGSGVTVVFSGTNAAGYTHAPTGGGTLDIAAPTSGAWSGVAVYQDPNLNSGTNIAAAGNTPAWDITGLVYLPHSDVTFSGIVNKASNGKSCFSIVVNTIVLNGTASILPKGECAAAGLNMPTNQVPGRGQLVW
jgi:Flp pilus assembly protein TadG